MVECGCLVELEVGRDCGKGGRGCMSDDLEG